MTARRGIRTAMTELNNEHDAFASSRHRRRPPLRPAQLLVYLPDVQNRFVSTGSDVSFHEAARSARIAGRFKTP